MKKEKREISEGFGSRLHFFRKERRLTLKQLGEMAGIDPSYINLLELGKRRAPSYPVIKNLSRALSISEKSLIDIEIEDEGEIKSLQELLAVNEFLINGAIPNKNSKESFINLVELLLNSEWRDNRHKEAVDIFYAIDLFITSLQEK